MWVQGIYVYIACGFPLNLVGPLLDPPIVNVTYCRHRHRLRRMRIPSIEASGPHAIMLENLTSERAELDILKTPILRSDGG